MNAAVYDVQYSFVSNSVDALSHRGNLKEKFKVIPIKRPNWRDWESIKREREQTDAHNHCFSQLKDHGLGEIHQVISLGETSAVKRSGDNGATFQTTVVTHE